MVHNEGSPIVTSQGEPVSDLTSSGEARSPDNSQVLEASGVRLLGSAILIGAGVLVEPELVAGALLGAGVLYAFPVIGQIMRPLVTTAVQLGYSAAVAGTEFVSQAGQQVQNIVADARSQYRQTRTVPSSLVR